MSILNKIEQHLAAATPLSVYRALIRRDALGLVYHAVSPQPLAHVRHLYPGKTPEMFARDLDYLRAHFNPISYHQLLARARGDAGLEPGSILVTFDDGYAECFTVVRELLHEFGIPAIFFIATGFTDNQRMFYRNKISLCLEAFADLPEPAAAQSLEKVNTAFGVSLENRQAFARWARSRPYAESGAIDALCEILGVDVAGYLENRQPYLTHDQIRALAAEGFTIGAHSERHVKFNRLTGDQIETEIVASCRHIAEITGASSIPFAFPFSGYGLDRHFLSDLVAKYDFLDLLFDARGIHQEQPFLFDRIWADPPPAPQAHGSNLPDLLHQAFQEHARWRRRYLRSVLMRRLKL